MSPATLVHSLVVGLITGSFYAFLALAFALVLAITRVLNLAHGELVVLGGYIGYSLWKAWGLPLPLLVPLAALASLPLGVIWRGLLGRVREPLQLNSLVLTFGLGLLLQNLMLGVWAGDYRLIAGDGGPPLALGGIALPPGRLLVAAISLGTVAGLHLALMRTRWGTALRATSLDPEAAALMGINTDRASLTSFLLAAAIAGGGGVLFATFHYLHPAAGVELTLLAIALSILGGVGRLSGLFLGGLLIGVVEALALTWAGPEWRELVVAAIVLLLLLLRPRGLAAGRGHP